MKKIVGIIIALLIVVPVLCCGLLQLVPVDKSNPAITREVQWDSDATRQLAERACFDCHSNETKWPWYSGVAPVSWLVVDDVNHGRQHLNFSEWDQPNEPADEIIEVIVEGEMPMAIYLPMHPEARLTAAEKDALVTGLETTLQNDPPISRR